MRNKTVSFVLYFFLFIDRSERCFSIFKDNNNRDFNNSRVSISKVDIDDRKLISNEFFLNFTKQTLIQFKLYKDNGKQATRFLLFFYLLKSKIKPFSYFSRILSVYVLSRGKTRAETRCLFNKIYT